MRLRRPDVACPVRGHSLYAANSTAAKLVGAELAYYSFAGSMKNAWSELYATEPLLRIATDGLYDAYVAATGFRPCGKCKAFFDEYGGAVRVDMMNGRVTSALWPRQIGETSGHAVTTAALSAICERRPVIGAFSTYASHLFDVSFAAGRGHIHAYGNHRLEALEDLHATFDVVSRDIDRFSLATVTKARTVLSQVGGPRVAPMLAKLTWLSAYLQRAANIRDVEHRCNLLWYDIVAAEINVFYEGHRALVMLLRNLEDGATQRVALSELSTALDRSIWQWL